MAGQSKDILLDRQRWPIINSLREFHRGGIIDWILQNNLKEDINFVENCLIYAESEKLLSEVSHDFLDYCLGGRINIKNAIHFALKEWDL